MAPTDLSDLSKAGIRYALEAARDAGAEVLFYHVIDLGGAFQDRRFHIGYDVLANRRRALDRFLAVHFGDRLDLVKARQVVEFGAPSKNIVDMAASEGADLIVMSTHRRTGIERFISGSVTEQVVGRAPCPVLAVPCKPREGTMAEAA